MRRYASFLSALLLANLSTAHPAPEPQPAADPQPLPAPAANPDPMITPRQADVPALLTIASIAGIQVPTDPAVLLSLAPQISALAGALPTEPVLSVLETAIPPGFLSSVINDPAFAGSFLSAFAAGSSPSWFTALPTNVKSYLHTYTGYGGIASGVESVISAESSIFSAISASSVSASVASAGTSGIQGSSGTESATTGAGATSSMTAPTTTPAESSAGGGGAAASSSISTGLAASPSAGLMAGIAGAVGILGLAAAL